MSQTILLWLFQLNTEFDAIMWESGTRIVISNLRRMKDKLEFDIQSEEKDIRILEDNSDSAEGSLLFHFIYFFLGPYVELYSETIKIMGCLLDTLQPTEPNMIGYY